jgi:pyruvate dehydrogenase complex dehydrogenase (E1) component
VGNENYAMLPMPAGEGVREGILRGHVPLRPTDRPDAPLRAQLLGSGAILNEALKAQGILAERYGVARTCGASPATRSCAATRWRPSAGTCSTPYITLATLTSLAREGKLPTSTVEQAVRDLDIDPEKPNPLQA